MNALNAKQFKTIVREWRGYRKLSQLDLALAADVSQRHVSWLETGRSAPSREMVLRLSDALEIPLRERNTLLQAAGFAPIYRESSLEAPLMAPVVDALRRILEHHEPLPAVVVDRLWNVTMQNPAAGRLLSFVMAKSGALEALGERQALNLAFLTVHPKGLRPFIKNWKSAAPALLRRLRSESLASGDAAVQAQYETIATIAGPIDAGARDAELVPVLPVTLGFDDIELNLFSVIATFGTPQDVTTDELRIETFYPGDEATREFFAERAGRN